MHNPITMPKLGLTMQTGTVVRWLKSVGDRVREDEIVAEIESDKITSEVRSPVSGTIVEVMVSEGEEAPVGQSLAIVGDPE